MNDGIYPVLSADGQAGTLRIEKRGLFTLLRLRADAAPGVMRLIGRTPGGWASLGIPVPKGGLLRLEKKLSQNDIDALGVDTADDFRLIPAGEELPAPEGTGSEAEADPPGDHGAPDEDSGGAPPAGWQAVRSAACIHPLLPDAAAIVRETEGSLLVALPFTVGEPFPAPGLFRYAQVMQIGGRSCAVFGVRGIRQETT